MPSGPQNPDPSASAAGPSRGAASRCEGRSACRVGFPGRSTCTAGRPADRAPPAKVAAAGRGRCRPCRRRIFPGPVADYGPEHREHRRRLRQRPRDLRGPSGGGPGGECPRGRQLPGEDGGFARPARQGALPDSSRDQEGRGGRGPNEPGGGQRPSPRAGGRGPGQSLQARTCHRGGQ